MNALVRQLRGMANELPAGQRRDVYNKLERIEWYFRRAGIEPSTETTDDDAVFERQKMIVYRYLMAGHTITSWEAIEKFGITRLSAVIFNIEKMTGKAPNRRMIPVTNRYGKSVRIAEYWIEQPDGMKTCPKCGRELPLESFGVCPENADGRTYYCNDCRAKFSDNDNETQYAR